MKRLSWLISILLLFILLPLITNAAESSSRLLPLKSQALVTVLQHSDYKDRNFYQPSARETSNNTSSEQALERMTAYPIVACRDDRICLIIMRKVNFQWVVSAANEQALVRDGLVLKTFSVDAHYSELEHTLYVYFDFEDENGECSHPKSSFIRYLPVLFFIDTSLPCIHIQSVL